eukprot:TRINITY_DN714_c0_g1_i7.p1 TRINITY_DN714_c0_g1~~TRINITY_DN714_c0_g1_i7.p1  ORF type:complete len:3918 (+),score=564.05 TRINITY_DN714_c0_g1_i7:76-11829(+)
MRSSALLVLACSATALGATYQLEMSPESGIYEGQEVRIGIKTDGSFNANNGELEVRVYKEVTGDDCAKLVVGSTTPLWSSTSWGRVDKASAIKTAAMTFTAPATASGAFVVCFKHVSGDNKWMDFITSASTLKRWTSVASPYSFVFPFATAGQNAIAKMTSTEGSLQFMASATTCYANPTANTCTGDMFKLVKKGDPCSAEFQDPDQYYGTNKVTGSKWTSLETAPSGVFHGSFDGGLGAFGTASINPVATTMAAGTLGSSAYVYVRVPAEAYDVCYSSVTQRQLMKQLNPSILHATPVWVKVKGCDDTTSACKDTPAWSFTPRAENVKWLSHDLSPSTYGTLVFEDTAGPDLNTKAYSGNLWSSTGGDMFKIVSSTKFEGKFPVGCWDTTNDDAYDLSLKPYGSKNLQGDVTLTTSSNDEADQRVTFGELYIPATGSWVVCYRVSKKGSGFRMLQFTSNPTQTLARRFKQLNDYTEDYLVPGKYGRDTGAYLSESVWTMDDKRASSEGYLVIKAKTGSQNYDTKQSTFFLKETTTLNVGTSVGSAMVLVPKDKSCFDYSAGIDVLDGGSAECMDGSAVSDRNNCMGSADNNARTEIAFYFTVPAGTHHVCFKHQSLNWVRLSDDFVATAAPKLRLDTLYLDRTEQQESFFAIEDGDGTTNNLQTGPWKDVLRLVKKGESCNVNPDNYNADRMSTYLSVYCKSGGAGVLERPCVNAAVVKSTYCRGVSCDNDEFTRAWFNANMKEKTPFNDIVPFNYASTVSWTAGFISIPAYESGKDNTWRVCYRQAKTNHHNWVVLKNDLVSSRAIHNIPISSPSTQTKLLGGETQEFKFTPSFTTNFIAKLVKYDQWAHCGNPAAGSDANVVESRVSGIGSTGKFNIFVPQAAGSYMLCIQTNSNSWKRSGVYTVVDNGVRWFVKAGSTPHNSAAIRVNLIKCTPGNDGACDMTANHEFFDTDIRGDTAKVVALNSACSAAHVDMNGDEVTMGPGDGPADVAEFVVTLPPGSVETSYKICVKTAFREMSRTAWVQVAQATGAPSQVVVKESNHNTREFITVKSIVANYQLLTGLIPSASAFNYPRTSSVVAGTSTVYVKTPSQTTTSLESGFRFNPALSKTLSASHQFKLVHQSIFDARWGSTFSELKVTASCFSQPVETATNTGGCSGDGCPVLTQGSGQNYVSAVFQFPVDPAVYLVCYRENDNSPWLQMKSTTSSTKIWAIPSMLEMEYIGGDDNKLSVYDRTMSNDKDAPSWCSDPSETANHGCPTTGYTKDYVRRVPVEDVCLPPVTSGAAIVSEGWYPLKAVTATTVEVDQPTMNEFIIPQGSETALKICVYKSGSKQHFTKGHVYQLFNRETKDGYWRKSTTVPAMKVTSSLVFDSNKRFMEWTSNTQDSYEGKTGLEIDGVTYRTPVIRSGEVVDFDVTLSGYSNEKVVVEKCEVADVSSFKWSNFECETVQADVTMIRNVHGTCSYKDSEMYGWSKEGLTQYAIAGRAQFRLQFMSACHAGYGCGIRFSVGATKSAPQWISVVPHYPDAVAINGVDVYPKKEDSRDITLVTCIHGSTCTIKVQARYQGPSEYAALGSVSAAASEDTGLAKFVSSWSVFSGLSWSTTGHLELSFPASAIELKDGTNEATVYMKIRYGKNMETWTRFAVKVVRPVPASIRLISVTPDDEDLSAMRTPTPAFIPTDIYGPLAELENELSSKNAALVAGTGSYVEALIPYKLRYAVFDQFGKVMETTQSLAGWTVSASFVTNHHARLLETSNEILKVVRPDGASNMDNLWTTEDTTKAFENEVPRWQENGWTQYFRIKNNVGCTRWSPCTVKFMWTKSGSSSMSAQVTTPVRVVGDSIKVTTPAHTKLPSSGSVQNGISVLVQAGTHCGTNCWYTDEYHYGNAFALFYNTKSDGGNPTQQGTVAMNGAWMAKDTSSQSSLMQCMYKADCDGACKSYGYSFRSLGQNTWGAQWTLKTDRDCPECKFTFHSDMGASPNSDSDVHTLSFTQQESDIISCSADLTVDCTESESKCETFDLTVSLGTPAADTCNPPKWRVKFASVTSTSNAKFNLIAPTASVAMGTNSKAKISGLEFTSEVPPSSISERHTIKLKAVKEVFGLPGNKHFIHEKEYTCETSVTLNRKAKPATTYAMKLDGVTLAKEMCSTPSGCARWYTTTADLSSGLVFSYKFTKTFFEDNEMKTETDTTARTFNIVALGGHYTSVTGSEITLGSPWDSTTHKVINGKTWSWGVAKVKFSGPISEGDGTLTMEYATDAVKQPARELMFRVCGKADSNTLCHEVRLWVLDSASPSIKVALIAEPRTNSDLRAARCLDESPTPTTLEAMAYTSIDNDDKYFYVYHEKLSYEFTYPGQTFYMGTTTDPAPTLTVQGPISKESVIDRLLELGNKDPKITATLYGTEVPSIEAKEFEVKLGESTDKTTTKYKYVKATGTINKWSLLDAVSMKNTCPAAEPAFSYFYESYRSYRTSAAPGQGWSYTTGAVAGIPFPLQTMVTDDGNLRAHTFAERKIRITRAKPHVGCNGNAVEVYSPKTSAFLSGEIASFEKATVSTDRGLATAWVKLDQPAERTVLQLDLCFKGTTDTLENCLTQPTAEDSDMKPILAERTKFTKPFSVAPRKATHLQIIEQTPSFTSPEIEVGTEINIKLEAVQMFGNNRWTFKENKKPKSLYVGSTYHSNDGVLKYGNGGFMKSAAGERCKTSLSGVSFVKLDETNMDQSFHFTRPCAACSVEVYYKLNDGEDVSSFSLRAWKKEEDMPVIGNIMHFNVKTCGTQWLLSGVPRVAIRERTPFSLSAVRVDDNNFPAWDRELGNSPAAVTVEKNGGNGNGMGGTLMQLSPAAESVDGKVTMRLEYSRPCFMCKVQFAEKMHSMTVLTDATRMHLLPTAHNMQQSKQYKAINDDAEWDLYAYWSDTRGYRAYTSSGPTPLSFLPRYMQGPVELGKFVINDFNKVDYTPMVQSSELRTLTTGSATAGVVAGNGTHFVNGSPFRLDDAGRFRFRLYNRPAIQYRLGSSYYMGRTSGFVVDFTVPATKMAVDRSAAVACSNTYVSTSCTFRAYAIGKLPSAIATTNSYYVSTTATGEATAAPDCGCATVEVTDKSTFTHGVATFTARATSISASPCTCNITVTPPAGLQLANSQKFEMTFISRPVTQWGYYESENVKQVRNVLYSIKNHKVLIHLRPEAQDNEYSNEGLSSQVTEVGVASDKMSPVGCFVCERNDNNKCTVEQTVDGITIEGHFPNTGTCKFNQNAISGLPVSGASSLVSTHKYNMEVMVQETTKATIVKYTGLMGSESNFGALSKLTRDGSEDADGMPAAVLSDGAWMVFNMNNGDDDHIYGDYHSIATVVASKNDAEVSTTTHTAQAGSIRVHLNPDSDTHNGDTHSGYTYKVTIATKFIATVTPQKELGNWNRVGPLYFVRVGTKLRVSIREKGTDNAWEEVADDTHWILKRPFDMKVEMVDSKGNLVSALGDYAEDATITIQPLTIPCRNVDQAHGFLTSTCIKDIGSCRKETNFDTLKCTDLWRYGDDVSGEVSNRDVAMQNGVAMFNNLRWVGEEGLQGLYVHAEPKEWDVPVASSFVRFDMQRDHSLRLDNFAVTTHEVKDALSVQATIVDQWDARVVAEDFTTFAITAMCEDTDQDVFLQQLSEGNRTFVNQLVAKANAGVVSFKDFYLSNPCDVAKLTIVPLHYSEEVPQSVTATSQGFKVQNSNNETVGVQTPFATRMAMSLGAFASETAMREFLIKVWVDEFANRGFSKHLLPVFRRNVQTTKDCVLIRLCSIPSSRKDGGVLKSDIASTSTDKGFCIDRATAINDLSQSTRVAHVLADDMTAFAEFDVNVVADRDGVEAQLQAALTTDLASDASSLRAANPTVFKNADTQSATYYTPGPTGMLAPEFASASTTPLSYLLLFVSVIVLCL